MQRLYTVVSDGGLGLGSSVRSLTQWHRWCGLCPCRHSRLDAISFLPYALLASKTQLPGNTPATQIHVPLCLKIMLPGITCCDAVFFAPRRRPAESLGPLARPWAA